MPEMFVNIWNVDQPVAGEVSEAYRFGRLWVRVDSPQGEHLFDPEAVERISPAAAPAQPPDAPGPADDANKLFDEAKYSDGDYAEMELSDGSVMSGVAPPDGVTPAASNLTEISPL